MKAAYLVGSLLLSLAISPVPAGSAPHAQAAPATRQGTTLTLLGTGGGPGGNPDRAGIASLLTVDGKPYVIDAGEGVSRQLARAGVSEADISTVFLTHLHDDHTAGLPGLATFAYTRRSKGMKIIGPVSTDMMVDGIRAYMKVSSQIRSADHPLALPENVITSKEVDDGQIYSDDRLVVTAVENTHFHLPTSMVPKHKSLTFRFKTRDKVIVFSGDTGPSDAVVALARGADILVCEIASAAEIARVPPDVRRHMIEEHLTGAEVGKLATAAGVNTVILSHFRSIAPADVAEVRRNFKGKVVVGADMSEF